MVNVDGAGGTCVCAEGLYGDPDRSWDGIIDDSDELKQIPVAHFRVLKLENVMEKGDGRGGLQLEMPEV
jgi:hypothetical protein